MFTFPGTYVKPTPFIPLLPGDTMTADLELREWLEGLGCQVEVAQEDDGSGYVYWELRFPVWKADQGYSVMSEPYIISVTL
jgi:hypothetical protein